ncbi:Kinase, NEK [Giardia muris]|uniref:Kinase, NEK n=1 Tax=Giardia muris TaxID=5742 RepID=A0A4Z1T0U9_GIAMU|nr:Kinase, NEK [Giardia muris]|eukprot:TNJ29328.1 Kinase, NEK [Giardia muris]
MESFCYADRYTETRVLEETEYQRLVEVAENATGEQYLCRQILLKDYTTKAVDRCIEEVTLATQVDSPFFAKVVAATYEPKLKRISVITEPLPLGSLHDYIYGLDEDQFVPEEECWRLMACILQGISQLHYFEPFKDLSRRVSRSIIHRYVLPRRIFLTGEGTCKLLDIGWARDLLPSEGKVEYIQGTLQYYPPEVVNQDVYTCAVDIFELGCTMYELLTKKVLLDDEPDFPMTALEKIQLPLFIPHYSKKLVDTVNSMLTMDDKKRPTVTQLLKITQVANAISGR